jgi:CubicO group peptidase (beta-lactamase class C family)
MTVVRLIRAGVGLTLGLSCCYPAIAAELSAESVRAIDAIVAKALSETGVPSASIAIVEDGRIVLAKAYGHARLEPAIEATPAMRYKIASNSKQLTATAILLLAEEHKLSLDDKVARFLPDLTRAKDVTLREVLTHTAGYSDYYADDYVPPFMQRATTADAILDDWAKKPLDFEPGTRWQYSNTGYVILGEIVEKASGRKLIDFLRERVFVKLGMTSAIDIGATTWDAADPLPYTRYALGPARIVPAEGNGWMWAAGELAMTASDLARWDISLMRGEILEPASLRALTTEMVLTDGTGTGYGLGLFVSQMANGHRRWAHTGGASGFLSSNVTFPDDHASITVLTNGEGLAHRAIESELETLLLSGVDADAGPSLARARALFAGLQKGAVDQSSITDDLRAYFSDAVLADFAASLGPLGEPTSFTQTSREDRGGMVHRVFTVNAGGKVLRMETYLMPDGRFEQCLVRASVT